MGDVMKKDNDELVGSDADKSPDHLISFRTKDDKTYYRIGTAEKEYEIVFDDVINTWIRELFYLLEYISELFT